MQVEAVADQFSVRRVQFVQRQWWRQVGNSPIRFSCSRPACPAWEGGGVEDCRCTTSGLIWIETGDTIKTRSGMKTPRGTEVSCALQTLAHDARKV
jgi:hypothetical protein